MRLLASRQRGKGRQWDGEVPAAAPLGMRVGADGSASSQGLFCALGAAWGKVRKACCLNDQPSPLDMNHSEVLGRWD